jgi:hypothetical protein
VHQKPAGGITVMHLRGSLKTGVKQNKYPKALPLLSSKIGMGFREYIPLGFLFWFFSLSPKQ